MTLLSEEYSQLDTTKINNLAQAEEYDWTLDPVSGFYYKTSVYLPMTLGVDFWLKPNRETAFSDDDVIEKPTDFSTAELDLTQSTADYRATYKTGIMNGKSVFRFAPNDFYDTGAWGMAGIDKLSIFAVVEFSDDGVLRDIFGYGNTGYGWKLIRQPNKKLYWYIYGPGGPVVTSIELAKDTKYLISAVYDGATMTVRVNGVVDGTPRASTGNMSAHTTRHALVARTMNGDIAELMFFEDIAIAGTDLTALESALMTEYGIS